MRILLLGLLFLAGCEGRPATRVEETDTPTYTVEHLFTTKSGVKVYKFYDAWGPGYVYFTDTGDVNWSELVSVGEVPHSEPRQTISAKRNP